jgi:enterochelin esterase-like enzyme
MGLPEMHMIRPLVAFVTGALVAASHAQTVPAESLPQGFILIVKDKSGLSSAESPLYLASNWGGWAPGDSGYRLSPRSDMRWQIIVKPPVKDPPPLEYKITRGGWEMCEVKADLSDISNRRLDAIDTSRLSPGQQPVIEIEVEKFSDQRPESQAKRAVDPYRAINATGTVKRLTVTGGGVPGQFRDALVWLPPGYADAANSSRRYPVLYMQDGQNIFEQLPGVPGEWRADEVATELIAGGKIEPLIIVGIPHAGPQRISEYLPVAGIGEVVPRGEAYVQFLISEVIPRVERTFRTAPGADNRAIGGSSLGGLISLYAGAKHPDIFGRVLAESPSLILGKKDLNKELFDSVMVWPGRIYLGMGGKESSDAAHSRAILDAVRALDTKLDSAAVGNHRLVTDEGATHTESAWAKRLPEALMYLFPPS